MAGKYVSSWWLKSRCVVATGELFSFIDVLMLEVRWRGRAIICFFYKMLFEIHCIQIPSKAGVVSFWPQLIVRIN